MAEAGDRDCTGITFDMGVLSQNVGTTPADLGIDLDATFAALQLKSACWAQLTATGTRVNEVNDGNGWVLVGDNSAQLQVFNLGPNDLVIPTQELNFRNIPTGATILINISGASPVVNAARVNADVTGSPVVPSAPALFNVLFNLYQATAASIPTEVNGSVLIPNGGLDLGGSNCRHRRRLRPAPRHRHPSRRKTASRARAPSRPGRFQRRRLHLADSCWRP